MSLASRERGQRGVVLLVVLFFALLLTSSVATFLRRATVDALIARNVDARGEADALARGGLLLSCALLAEDRLQELAGTAPVGDSYLDAWARVADQPLMTPKGTTLRLRIEDAGARLNLNSLFQMEEGGAWKVRDETPEFLTQLLAKVIDEQPVTRGPREYEPAELAENLIDFVDGDESAPNGSPEDDIYQRRSPPTRALNRPLLSFDELRLVAGFDAQLVEALRPYLTVYPFAALGCGNPSAGLRREPQHRPAPRAGPALVRRRRREAARRRRHGSPDPARPQRGRLAVRRGPKPGGLHADTGDRAQRDLSAADVLDPDLRGQRRGERGRRAPHPGGGGGPNVSGSARAAILADAVRGNRCRC